MNKVTVKGLRKSPFSPPFHPVRHHVSCASRKRDSQTRGRGTRHLVGLELDFFFFFFFRCELARFHSTNSIRGSTNVGFANYARLVKLTPRKGANYDFGSRRFNCGLIARGESWKRDGINAVEFGSAENEEERRELFDTTHVV